MRDIKFRVWDKKEKKMHYPKDEDYGSDYVAMDLEGHQVGAGDSPANWMNVGTDVELMQYTGLKDSNGVEIYEGDILELDKENNIYSHTYRLKVSYKLNGFNFQPSCKWEVIGNIYENKELLK